MEGGCSEPEDRGNGAEKSGSLVEESENLVEESWSLVQISGNLIKEIWNVTEENRGPAEENRGPAEENRSLAKESGNPAEENGNLMEESRSPAVPENCSTPPVPLEATAVLADLSQPAPSPPRPLSVHCQEAVGQNCSPPAAGDAEAGIPMEVPQEEVAAEKPSTPKTPSKGLEEDKGQEEEAVKESGNTGQDLVADIPEEPGKEVTPDVHKMTEQADPSPGEPEKDSCVGRPVAWQRNSAREFYSCPICRKTFLLKINLLIHQRGHTNWVPYVCVHCDRKFMSKKKIRRHLRAWAANGTCQPSELEASKPEECPSQTLCPSSQPQAPSRDCGTVWQEPGPARCSLPPGKMMYTCTECRETFSNQVFLTVHQRRHSGHHLILCPCCNRSFTWVSDFVRQHWMLMGVRPHQCGICQKTFKRFSHLKAHQRIHRRQERPFARANPVPVVAEPAAGDGVGSQAVTPQGWGAAVGP
ncbi:zinc finger protein 777-like [Motacilla alba alba]|uniref:zinc finger protein 777-like n=1 Tax=Motacilla alba alba TaxID=1094192 RepID=UPI0018D54B0D|nr:zinc finger protein 777-like [Motacilla alba alba]